ncbi:transposase [Nitrosomonas eutropha]|uniref:transposase n=1 Tax=Nitrosomonas eutropha TaxID=916 RepID=UPI0009F58A73
MVAQAYKNKSLSARQTHQQKTPNIVERCFSIAKRLSGMKHASYFSTIKINAHIIMKCIGMNLKKVANKIFINDPSAGKTCPVTA